MKIVFLGGGNMAKALVQGLREKGTLARDLTIIDPDEAARDRFSKMSITALQHISENELGADVFVLAVKPQTLREALSSTSGLSRHALVISIVAGIPISSISKWLDGKTRIIRVMPNTPSLIQAGVSGIFAGEDVTPDDREVAEKIVGSVGRYIWCAEESLIDLVTAVSGSGPAYVFYFIEALESVAIEMGLDKESARLLAIETFLGSARLAARSDESPKTLRERVTSRGGTTAAAIQIFEQGNLAKLISSAVRRAKSRASELAEEYGG